METSPSDLAREMEWWRIEDFMNAVREGDLTSIQERILREDIDLDQRHMGTSLDGPTPLLLAAERGHTDVVLFLVKSGADPKMKTMSGMTLLHCAAASLNCTLVRVILEQGLDVDINARDRALDTPVMTAVANGDCPDLVNLLCDFGADLHAVDMKQNTALHIACRENRKQAAQVLIQRGVPIHTRDIFRRTPLSLTSDNDIILALFDRGAAIPNVPSMLNDAVTWGYPRVVERLLERGADPNARGPDTRTPLYHLIEAGHRPKTALKILNVIEKSGVRLDLELWCTTYDHREPDQIGPCTPFLFACAQGELDIAMWLRDRGADVRALEANFTYTALHLACMHLQVEVIEWLLYDVKLSPHASSKDGTPLALCLAMTLQPSPAHIIFNPQHVSIVEDIVVILLEAGASPCVVFGNPSKTVLEWALRARMGTIALLLTEYGAMYHNPNPVALASAIENAPPRLRDRLEQTPRVPSLMSLAARCIRATMRDTDVDLSSIPYELRDLVVMPHPYQVAIRASADLNSEARGMYECGECKMRQSLSHAWCVHCLAPQQQRQAPPPADPPN